MAQKRNSEEVTELRLKAGTGWNKREAWAHLPAELLPDFVQVLDLLLLKHGHSWTLRSASWEAKPKNKQPF